jgi:hypothetical protein
MGKGSVIQFQGPAHAVLNAADAKPAPAGEAAK